MRPNVRGPIEIARSFPGICKSPLRCQCEQGIRLGKNGFARTQELNRAPPGLLLNSEETELCEQAVALKHGGVDRAEQSAVWKQGLFQNEPDQGIPPGGVVGVDHKRNSFRVRQDPGLRDTKRMKVTTNVAATVRGEPPKEQR